MGIVKTGGGMFGYGWSWRCEGVNFPLLDENSGKGREDRGRGLGGVLGCMGCQIGPREDLCVVHKAECAVSTVVSVVGDKRPIG